MSDKNNERRKWLDKQYNLFKFKFWTIEALILVLLFIFWDYISNKLGIYDNPLFETFIFILIFGVLTTINEYFHSKKGAELEMQYNIDAITEYMERSLDYYNDILSIIKNNDQNTIPDKFPKVDITTASQSIQEETYDDNKSRSSITETLLQNNKFETSTKTPLKFDPIDFLIEAKANRNVLESQYAKEAIRKCYIDCANDIINSNFIPRSERKTKNIYVSEQTINMSIEIKTSNGINYWITFDFTNKG